VRALLFAHAVEAGNKVFGEDLGHRATQHFGPRHGVHALHLGVPALDTVFEIDGKDADVNRLDDVLVELLEPLEFADLLFEPLIELGVLNGDSDVAGERFQQFHILAGEKIAVVGAAQSDDGDSTRPRAFAVGDSARKVVVQIQIARAAALRVGKAKNLLRSFEKDMTVGTGTVEVEKADVERLQVSCLKVAEAV
jgi:hypothetical protein